MAKTLGRLLILAALCATVCNGYCVHSSTNSKLGYDPHGILKPEAVPMTDPLYVIVENIVRIFYHRGAEDIVDALTAEKSTNKWTNRNPQSLKDAKHAIRNFGRKIGKMLR